jgi:hypothetical protein
MICPVHIHVPPLIAFLAKVLTLSLILTCPYSLGPPLILILEEQQVSDSLHSPSTSHDIQKNDFSLSHMVKNYEVGIQFFI